LIQSSSNSFAITMC